MNIILFVAQDLADADFLDSVMNQIGDVDLDDGDETMDLAALSAQLDDDDDLDVDLDLVVKKDKKKADSVEFTDLP